MLAGIPIFSIGSNTMSTLKLRSGKRTSPKSRVKTRKIYFRMASEVRGLPWAGAFVMLGPALSPKTLREEIERKKYGTSQPIGKRRKRLQSWSWEYVEVEIKQPPTVLFQVKEGPFKLTPKLRQRFQKNTMTLDDLERDGWRDPRRTSMVSEILLVDGNHGWLLYPHPIKLPSR